MKVHVTIEREEGEDDSTSMGISAAGIPPYEVCKLLLAGAEMVVYDHVRDSLRANGATEEELDYGAPLRTRLLALEIIIEQEPTPYSWVQLDMNRPPDE